MVQAVRWEQGALSLLDQRLLPHEVKYVTCADYRQTAKAIADMIVRGAPAIGISGATGWLWPRLRRQIGSRLPVTAVKTRRRSTFSSMQPRS